MMKRVFAVLCCALLIMTIAGCASKGTDPAPNGAGAASAGTVKIGYIAGDSDSLMMSRRAGISDTCASAIFVADGAANNWSAAEAQAIAENWISGGLINDMNFIACMDDALANAAITALGDDYPDISHCAEITFTSDLSFFRHTVLAGSVDTSSINGTCRLA